MQELSAPSLAVSVGLRLAIVAHPRAKQARVVVSFDRVYHVYVTEPPEHGKANQAIQHALADYLDIPPSRLELAGGQASKYKAFTVL